MRLRRETVGMVGLALLLVALAAWTTIHETSRWRFSPFGDFNYLQTGGECLVDGFDPYDYAALNAEGRARGEKRPIVWPQTPVYPPSSLLVLLPFENVSWPLAAYTYNGLAGLGAAFTCVLMVWHLRLKLWDAGALILFSVLATNPIASALEFGNPALLCTGLMAIGCLLLLQDGHARRTRSNWLGWILIGLAAALKPQLAAGAIVFLLWKPETRRAAWKAAGLALALLVIGLLAYRLRLGSFHYLQTLKGVLNLSVMPNGSSDFTNGEAFDFLNIQTGFARIPHASRVTANALAWATTFGLAATAWVFEKRSDALQRMPWTILALVEAISVLPVYHRGYDRVIALLLAPAAVELARTRAWLAWVYAVTVAFWVANDTVLGVAGHRWQFKPQNGMEDVLFCGLLLFGLRVSGFGRQVE